MNKRPIISLRALIVFASLIFASIICVALVIVRAYRTDHVDYAFMVWNLFLAWIPFIMAFIAYRLHRAGGRWAILAAGFGLLWLLFLPNAPYMLTDLIHLRYRDDTQMWYDLMLLLWFAWTGFMLGFGSLYLMQRVVTDWFGRIAGWLFAMAAIGLTSFGIYLGRFLRWNSWDILSNPMALFGDIYHTFRHPIANFQMHMFWLLLALFLGFVYVMVTTLPALHHEQQEAGG
jgi:uncharacterized membrane protein